MPEHAAVPSRNPRIWLTVSDEERRALFEVWTELRNQGRRRRPEYIGQRLSFNQWLKGLTADGAARARQALAAADAAQTSGTVETMPKTKTALTMKTQKTHEPSKPPAERPRPPGRPRGTYKENLTLSLDKDIIAWLKAQSGGPSATANAVLRRSLRRRKSPQ